MESHFMKDFERELNRLVPPRGSADIQGDEVATRIEEGVRRGRKLRGIAVTYVISHAVISLVMRASQIVRRLSAGIPTQRGE